MVNPLQQQLLKAGLVTSSQVQKANQDKHKKRKQHAATDKAAIETQAKIRQAAEDKARRDRELNLKKQQQAKQKAISLEINQLISDNCLPRDESCDISYNFEHRGKVRRIYVNNDMKQQIMLGKLGIARIEGGYELVPQAIAEKILQRNEKRVVVYTPDEQPPAGDKADENDPYAAYKVPDDLMW